jgi:hypothetical protein
MVFPPKREALIAADAFDALFDRLNRAITGNRPPSELMAEPRNSRRTARSNPSRNGPDFASPIAFAIKPPLRRA